MKWTYGIEVEQFSFYEPALQELRNRVTGVPHRFHRDMSGPGEFIMPPEDHPAILATKFIRLTNGIPYPVWQAQRSGSGCGSHFHLIPDWESLSEDQKYKVILFTWNTTVTLVALTLPFFSVSPLGFRQSINRWAAPTLHRLDRNIVEEYAPSTNNILGRHRGREFRSITFNTNNKRVTTLELRLNEQIPSWVCKLMSSYDDVFKLIWNNRGRSPRLKNHYATLTSIYKGLPTIDMNQGPIEFDVDEDGVERGFPGLEMRYDSIKDFFFAFCNEYQGKRSKGGNVLEFMAMGYHPSQLPKELQWKPGTIRNMLDSVCGSPPIYHNNKPVTPIKLLEVEVNPVSPVLTEVSQGRQINFRERIVK